jgi:hypothetical protein
MAHVLHLFPSAAAAGNEHFVNRSYAKRQKATSATGLAVTLNVIGWWQATKACTAEQHELRTQRLVI